MRGVLVMLLALCAVAVMATETENLGIRVLPAPAKMTIDGHLTDWDLSGGVLACSNVEHLRDKLAVWIHTQYDAENLYVLARWIDETPMNNPGSIAGDSGWSGDCLQLRIVTDAEASGKKVPMCWLTAWRDRDGKDVINLAFPNGGGTSTNDAKAQGAQQAFLKNADGKGYTQEIALPWRALAEAVITPKPGGRIILSAEPNFCNESKFRISMKDIFRAGVTPDRVFTFRAYTCWGYAAFTDKGAVEPQRLRLADARDFPVKMEKGVPVVDWTELFDSRKLEGFSKIPLTMPEDGYVSVIVKNAQGQVVRQLLNATFLTKGTHQIPWDGLTNMSHLKPGEIVPAGAYTWEAIRHNGLGLRLVGWAHNGGRAPFDSPGGNWGGDQGHPTAVETDGKQIYLGWGGAEAGKAVVTTDLDGNVKWRHKRGGFGNARLLATDAGVVYVYDRQQGDNIIYRLTATKGEYLPWKDSESATLDVTALLPPSPTLPPTEGKGAVTPTLTGMTAAAGKLYVSYGAGNVVAVVDSATGKLLSTLPVEGAGDLEVGPDGKLYVLSAGSKVLRLTPADGKADVAVDGLVAAAALALDADGVIYVGVTDPDNQVKVFGADGKPLRTIGKAGGRPLLGPWVQGGMRFIRALRVDVQGKLWVMEADDMPRRVSVWEAKSGAFVKEFFGPTDYGAVGGAISPLDPTVMVGHGCEWKLDPATGKAACVGVFHRGAMGNSRFGLGPKDRQYLAVGSWRGTNPVSIYERLGAGQWKLRTTLSPLITDLIKNGKPVKGGQQTGMTVWADANDDGQEQPTEIQPYPIDLGGWINGWYMPMTQSLIFYGGVYRIAPTGWTACGAPQYDLTQAKKLPTPADMSRGGMGAQRGTGSEDGKLAVYNGRYGADHSDFQCFDIDTGTLQWSYPNNYVGVHGGHRAPPPQTGMIRGAYDFVGTGKLPEPIGDIFVIGTDKGEWHVLTGEGYYLTKFFESDPMKIQWPSPAAPGAVMDAVPPGMGAEDFGGSMSVTKDGQLYLQAGKTAFINMKVVGLETVKRLGTGKLTVSDGDLTLARGFRDKLLQQSVGTKIATIKAKTVAFTGDVRADFNTKEPLVFSKGNASTIEAAIAYDTTNLYLGWTVRDDTPWINGATEPAVMYCTGDTVDFQLGADPKADRKRSEAVLGDFRLSIGNFQGKPTAVVYRRVATTKQPRKFYSGIVRDGYEMQSVTVLPDAKIDVKIDAKAKRYIVEAAIPLASLGLTLAPGLKLTGDIGATHGDPAGDDTGLRTYWNNQATGLVADEVYELKMDPKNWGELVFE
jgi:hypothetical protein